MKLYLAHPFDSRHSIREWELITEVKFELELVNPFYDLGRSDVDPIDDGRHERYERLDPEALVSRDIEAIGNSDGVIAFVNGELSYGTIMEVVYAHLLNLPVYAVVTNGHHDHPWLRYHATEIFKTVQELENHLCAL